MRNVTFFWLAVVLVLPFPVNAVQAWQGSPGKTLEEAFAKVAFEQARHFIVVDVKLRGDDDNVRKFLFDTGINLTMLDIALAHELKLVKLQEVPATDSSGSAGKMGIYSVDEIELGAVKASQVIVGTIDFATLRQQVGVPIVGILGDNFLREFCLRIDYRQRTISFFESNPTPSSRNQIKALQRPPFTPIAIPIKVDGVELEGIIDTGAHDIGLPWQLLDGLQYPAAERLTSKGAMTGGLLGAGGQDLLVRIKSLQIGQLALEQYPTFSVKHEKALLGYRFLSQFIVTIDYPLDTVVLERYEDAKFPNNVLHTGMALNKTDAGMVQVKGLWVGAAADKLGIQVGDTIEQIDGKPIADLAQSELGELATDPSRRAFVLDMRTGNGLKQLTLHKAWLFPEPAGNGK